jgi:hypothetical protein
MTQNTTTADVWPFVDDACECGGDHTAEQHESEAALDEDFYAWADR